MATNLSGRMGADSVRRTAARSLRFLSDRTALRSAAQVETDYWKTARQVRTWATSGRETLPDSALFISFSNLPIFAKFEGVLAANLRRQGFAPIVVTHHSTKTAQRYHRLFGIRNTIVWEEWTEQFPRAGEEGFSEAESLLVGDIDVQRFKNFQYKGVYAGRHALSRTARTQLTGRLNFNDREARNELRKQLMSAVKNVDLSLELFKQFNPAITFVRDPGYVPQGQLFEVGLSRGADSIYYTFGQKQHTWIFKRYNYANRDEHYFSLSPSTWRKSLSADWTARHQAELDAEFAGRYEPASQLDTRRLQEGKRLKTIGEIRDQLGLDPEKKTAVVFSHITWDEALFFGTDLFDDFEHWLLETTRAACLNTKLNWVIKLHPGNVIKVSDQQKAQIPSELQLLSQLGPLPNHIKILRADTDINTSSLFPLIDYGLTVRGTIGLELPCFGIPVVLAGTGRYSRKGFTIDPTSRQEYLKQIETLHFVSRLSEEQTLMAKKHAHALFLGRQTSFEDICPMQPGGDSTAKQLQMNLSFTAASVDEFSNSHSLNRLARWLTSDKSPDLI